MWKEIDEIGFLEQRHSIQEEAYQDSQRSNESSNERVTDPQADASDIIGIRLSTLSEKQLQKLSKMQEQQMDCLKTVSKITGDTTSKIKQLNKAFKSQAP